MRSTRVALCLLTSLAFPGCTASGGLDDVALRPSLEVTSSIGKPNTVAPDAIAPGAEADRGAAAATASAPTVEPAVDQSKPQSVPEAVGDAMALIAPLNPVAGALPAIAGVIHEYRFRDAKPINFGKASPRQLAVHGVDVSRWQGRIDWVKLRSQGANFAYIKATDGGDHLDPMFRANWRAADRAGLKRGAYHFFYWCRTAGEQADWFIRNVPKVEGALPPVIDVEWNGESKCSQRLSRTRVLDKMKVFMDKVERHYGQRPIIYTAPDFYADNLTGEFLDYPFWLRSVAAHPSKRYPGRKWVFWQYSGSGLSHGVSGRIDLNVFHGSERQWRAWAGGQQAIADAD